LGRELIGQELDQALEAFADYADVKSPFMLGHSRGVAQLAAAAAATVGLPSDDVMLVRRAALVHDVGAIGVSAGILDKTARLTEADRERIRTHPYLTARTFSKPPALRAIGQLAVMHHERMDGSGYPSGLTGDALPMTARVIAAADVYHALREPRPHRAARTPEAAREVLTGEATGGRLDGDAVRAVLDAAGHRVGRRAGQAGGLTAREVEVLVLVARGLTKKEIAQHLSVSAKTVNAHVEHLYTKLGVSSRGGAALFAMRHGLMGVGDIAEGAPRI
jgi:HD-GYP domain-containing protein (c-di-GMP phosphodiesterase class II)